MMRRPAFLCVVLMGTGLKQENYQDKELIVVDGGTGGSPGRGVISYFGEASGWR